MRKRQEAAEELSVLHSAEDDISYFDDNASVTSCTCAHVAEHVAEPSAIQKVPFSGKLWEKVLMMRRRSAGGVLNQRQQ